MSNADITGPVLTTSYVELGHQFHDMIHADGDTRLATRYQHVVTGVHYVRDIYGNRFGEPVYEGRDDAAANRAWVALYRKYN